MLRSSKNLDGRFKAKDSEGKTIIAVFDKERLSLTYTLDNGSNVLNGRYRVADKTLEFHIGQKEQTKGRSLIYANSN